MFSGCKIGSKNIKVLEIDHDIFSNTNIRSVGTDI